MDPPAQLRDVVNFRDVGQTVNRFLGRSLMREGLLFRSARPDAAGLEDRAWMRDGLGIRTIIDLRTDTELRQRAAEAEKRRGYPASASASSSASTRSSASSASSSSSWSKPPRSASLRIAGIDYQPVNLIGRPVERHLMSQLTWWAFVRVVVLFLVGQRRRAARIMTSDVLVPTGLVGLCTLTLDHGGAEVRRVLALCARATPALVHCTHGKDRTGLVCALVLLILDVPTAAIEHDYFLTDAALLADRADRLVEVRKAGFPDDWSRTADDMITRTQRHLDTKYGGLDAYLDHIGFGPDDRARLRSVLLC